MEQIIILTNNTVVGSGTGGAAAPAESATGTATETPQQAPTGAGSFFASGNMQLLITMAAVFAVMYFFTIRPQKKREMQLKEIQNSIKSGDWVVTFSGMYGKAVDVGADVVMVEFGSNKSVRIPVRKTELTKSSEPSLAAKSDQADDK